MRMYLRNDQASRAFAMLPPKAKYKRGVVIQVLGAGTVWFDPERATLENTDVTGIPTAGNSITSTNGPFQFQQWNNEMWVRGSAIGVVLEVNEFEVF